MQTTFSSIDTYHLRLTAREWLQSTLRDLIADKTTPNDTWREYMAEIREMLCQHIESHTIDGL